MTILIIWLVIVIVAFYGLIYGFTSAFGGVRTGIEACVGITLIMALWTSVGTLIYYTLKEIAKHIV